MGCCWRNRTSLRAVAILGWVAMCVSPVRADERAAWMAELSRLAAADSSVDAAGAVDGHVDGGFGFHTDQEDQPWWQVDLGEDHALDRLVIFNRSVSAERASRLIVRLSSEAGVWQTAYEHDGTVFYGHQDQQPLVVPLHRATARYVRLQVLDSTWLHLDEVQLFGVSDPASNLALHKPATQSSVSAWSRQAATPRAADLAALCADTQLGKQVVRQQLDACGLSARELMMTLDELVSRNYLLDDPRWVELFAEARRLQSRWDRVRAQWQRFSVEALQLAVRDLTETYGSRYPAGGQYLQRLAAVAPALPDLAERLERGEWEALAQAEGLLALQREALLANPLLAGQRILLVTRSESAPALGLPANFNGNEALPRTGFDDELAWLSPVRPEGELATLYRPGGQFVGDVDLHFSGERVLFSSVDERGRWRVFEIGIDGSGLRQPLQIEESDVDNYDACYLPEGGMLFGSTATYVGVPCVFGSSEVANLHVSDERSGEIRRLTFDQEHNWNPTVLPDGRVMYLRWEYADLPHSNSRILFSMSPDGSRQMALYGSNSYFPNSFFYAQPIPDGSSRVIGIATGHHGTVRSGRLLILDPALGREEADGVVQEIPGRGRKVEALVRDRLVDGVWPQFIHPYPLGDPTDPSTAGKYFLVSAKLSPTAPWSIYLVDVFDNVTLIKERPGFALFEPILVQPRPLPTVLVNRGTSEEPMEATVYMVDVHHGGGLTGVPRGEVKQLRVISYYFSPRGMGGLLGVVGMDGPWDIRQILGTVPVQEDGSALFTIPANTPVAVQPLDAEGKALQQMRSWFVGMPGEVVSCVGCHERQNDATLNRPTTALLQPATPITPWYGPSRGFSFAREVQPVLDHYCVTCHDGAGAEPDLRGSERITDWSSEIAGHAAAGIGGQFSVAYANLHRFVRRPGIESDLRMLAPLDFHADTTELVQILQRGHYGVELDRESWDRLITWMDLNTPYHGTWSEIMGAATVKPIVERRRELERRYARVDVDWDFIGPAAMLSAPNPAPTVDRLPDRDPSTVAVARPKTEGGQVDASPPMTRTIELRPGVTMQLALIPAGRFAMGNQQAPDARGMTPVVEIDRPYWLGTCEVTNEQYACFDPHHDSRLESRHGYQFGRLGYPLNEPRQPVVRVSWYQAIAYCDWLSEQLGVPCSLPTEAQWEYACRSGTESPFHFGDFATDFSEWANLGDRNLSRYAECTAHDNYESTRIITDPSPYDDWVPKEHRFDDGAFVSSAVGRYRPNAWGLYDMHGNVWEWTRSTDAAYPYRDDDGRNDATSLARRSVRGGSWYDRPQRATSDYRLSYRAYQRVFNVGFRVLVEADPHQAELLLTRKE